MSKQWQVWSTANPAIADLSDVENPPDSPEAAVRSACAWNLRADGGSWFGGGVATLGVESPDGERWTCAAWLTAATGELSLSPMVRLDSSAPSSIAIRVDLPPRPNQIDVTIAGDASRVWAPRHGGGATLTVGGEVLVEIEPLGAGWWVSAGHAGSDGVNGTLQEAKVRALELLSGVNP